MDAQLDLSEDLAAIEDAARDAGIVPGDPGYPFVCGMAKVLHKFSQRLNAALKTQEGPPQQVSVEQLARANEFAMAQVLDKFGDRLEATLKAGAPQIPIERLAKAAADAVDHNIISAARSRDRRALLQISAVWALAALVGMAGAYWAGYSAASSRRALVLAAPGQIHEPEQPTAKANPVPDPSAPTAPKPQEYPAVLSVSPPAGRPVQLKEPEMILLKGGKFEMGSNEDPAEKPIHTVNVRPFWMAKHPVTVREWRECVAANACTYSPSGEVDTPVSNVSWDDAMQFLSWLSQETGRRYRLPTEAEWEYAARAGTHSKYWWGDQINVGEADCKGCGAPYDARQPTKIGSFPPNPFGLYEMAGSVAQWLSDCWHKDYHGAPTDGSSWDRPDCNSRVLRGGSWRDGPISLRVSDREYYDSPVRYLTHGFRVARSEEN